MAQYAHGFFYEHSRGANKALTQAAEWYRKAAEGNYAPAQLRLGELAEEGMGIRQDLQEAAQWYEKAARQGNAEAQRQIGLCYLYGRGVAQDDQSAFKWFEQSARQDNPAAEHALGYLYQEGRGVARDYHAAFAWHYRAAVLGNPLGQWNLASLYLSGKGVKEDAAEALRWYLKAEAGLPNEQQLTQDLVQARWKAFLESPGSVSTFDPSTLPAAMKSRLLKFFLVLAGCYLVGGIALFYATMRAGNAPVKIRTAIGWIAFLLEGQACAFVGLCLTTTTLGASTLLGAMSALGAVPVIASSCGPARFRFWKKPPVSTRTLWLCGLAAYAGMILVSIAYDLAYALLTHAHPPAQPTIPLLLKAKTASVWVTYMSAAFVLPVAEELIFRGYLFDALRRYFSDRNVIVITALVFSAVHLQWVYFVPIAGLRSNLGLDKAQDGFLVAARGASHG